MSALSVSSGGRKVFVSYNLQSLLPTVNSKEPVRKIAQQKDFLLTGGSDDHGPKSVRETLGKIHLPYCYVEAMKKRCNL